LLRNTDSVVVGEQAGHWIGVGDGNVRIAAEVSAVIAPWLNTKCRLSGV
jgi:hypothetical protein